MTIEVEVRYYTVLREITGNRSEKVTLKPKSVIQDLLNYLVEKHGETFESYVYSGNNRLNRNISLMLNGVNIRNIQGFKTPLDKDDIISFLPPVGGG
jgi:MoaD family protein